MHFEQLRDNVERFAGAVRQSDKYERESADIAAGVFLTLGQSLVGCYEELHGIRQALEQRNELLRKLEPPKPVFGPGGEKIA